ncbi:MAG TPA: hypothetical protein VK469_22165, partial [Candidatus Kapabacteria bacterium]|nr:hypothetical protein [Candidatus Kapabacteria bacterium]
LEKEALRIEPKQLKKRGGDSMDKKGQVKKTEANLGLIEILKESNEWMKPETLFEKAGYTHETIEEFYGELKRFVENNEIYEKRQNDSDVFLGINDHENRKTVDKRI